MRGAVHQRRVQNKEEEIIMLYVSKNSVIQKQ